VTSDALGVKEQGRCTFRGDELSLVVFGENGKRNSYVCSSWGFTLDTKDVELAEAPREESSAPTKEPAMRELIITELITLDDDIFLGSLERAAQAVANSGSASSCSSSTIRGPRSASVRSQ